MKVFSLLGVLAVCLLATTVTAQKSKKIALKDLPPAVSQAIQKKFKDVKLKEAWENKVDGKLEYGVDFTYKNTNATVFVEGGGKILSGYRFIGVNDPPEAVLKALDDQFPKG